MKVGQSKEEEQMKVCNPNSKGLKALTETHYYPGVILPLTIGTNLDFF